MIHVKNIPIGEGFPLVIISGPCIIEDEDHTLACAEFLKKNIPFPFIFKASFDKANRSSVHSYRGPGIDKGLKILEKVKKTFDLPILTDIHLPEQALLVKEVVDMIQIPAFLCRQTDLLLAAAKTHLPINVKKGQFLSPFEMENIVIKLKSQGNDQILLTDRGTSFGYQNLVSDMRSIPIMKRFAPVCFDASHSVQLPGSLASSSGGQREFIPTLAKAAVAAGADALFFESHPDPKNAKSDSATVFPFSELPRFMQELTLLSSAIEKIRAL